ncbi:FAD-binding protein [Dyadobacter sp. NIV53]|nr:FAD-binding protein [Dyadobacter sp. NIV53]
MTYKKTLFKKAPEVAVIGSGFAGMAASAVMAMNGSRVTCL